MTPKEITWTDPELCHGCGHCGELFLSRDEVERHARACAETRRAAGLPDVGLDWPPPDAAA